MSGLALVPAPLAPGIPARMLTPNAAFLSHILLPSGQTVIEHVQHQKLLPLEAGLD